jgi:hypothetical protein
MRHYATSRLEPSSSAQRERLARIRIQNGAKKIAAKYPGTCDVCGHSIEAGASIWWSKGAPATHEECVDATGIEQYEPGLNRREAALLTQAERDEYAAGRLEDADDKAAWIHDNGGAA